MVVVIVRPPVGPIMDGNTIMAADRRGTAGQENECPEADKNNENYLNIPFHGWVPPPEVISDSS